MESPVQCEYYAHAAPGFFSLAGTAVKASGTDAQLDAAGSVLWGLGAHEVRWTSVLRGPERSGDFPQQAENRFRVTKALLAEEWILKNRSKFGRTFD